MKLKVNEYNAYGAKKLSKSIGVDTTQDLQGQLPERLGWAVGSLLPQAASYLKQKSYSKELRLLHKIVIRWLYYVADASEEGCASDITNICQQEIKYLDKFMKNFISKESGHIHSKESYREVCGVVSSRTGADHTRKNGLTQFSW